jgi:multidrug efflux pump subunit AcrB
VKISDAAIRNRTAVAMFVLLIAVAGVYSYAVLPRESVPDVPIPYIMISSTYEGVSPQDVETQVTMKIEKQLTGLKGVKQINSSSMEGMSLITIEFLPDVAVEDALQRVKDKVGQARRDLPQEVEEPSVTDINVADLPIIMINMSGPVSPVVLKEIADRLQDEFEKVPGVMACSIIGALEPEIRLEIDQDRVAAYGLTVPEILRLIPSENVNVSAGGLETQGMKFNVRVPAEFEEAQQIYYLILTYRNGRPIYLSDVAVVRDAFKDRTSFARINSQPSITLSIQKRIGGNILNIAAGVEKVLEVARQRAPAGVSFDITHDRSKDIRSMVSDLEHHILTGLVLVVGVLLIFLGWRASIIVALAIPLSLMISFAVLMALGYTLNMIVLFSLIMVLGMLVDDAIVIVENVYRHMQMGYSRVQAARLGTAEVAWPVITSTATKIAAFAPMAFWPGVMGSFMKYLPITLVITLFSSLVVAMIINPTICAVFGGKMPLSHGDGPIIRAYKRLIALTIRYRGVTVSLTALVLIALGVVYGKYNMGKELFPNEDPKQATVNVRLPQGANIAETDRLARLVESRIRHHQQKGEIETIVNNVGSSESNIFFGAQSGPHMASLSLIFPDYEVRTRPSADVVAEIRDELADIPGAEIKVEKHKDGPPTGAAVTVRIIGEDFAQLQSIANKAKRSIEGVSGLVNLRSDFEGARPELAFHVDRRRAAMLGVNTAIIGNFLKTAIFGAKVGTYRVFNDEYDITVRLPLAQRQSIDELMRLRVPNATGGAVPLSSLGTFAYVGGKGTISRIDQNRVITLTGDAEGRLSEAVLADVQSILAGMELPTGYTITYAGEKEEQEKAMSFLSKAFVIALLLIWLVLVLEFNTLSAPIIIMSTVVLSLIGVLVGLLVHAMPFGVIMTGVGVISLTGVVVANGIVLLDFTRQLQRRGMDVVSAAVQASATRLRPVFLTAVTAILGLMPMATGISFDFANLHWVLKSESSQWWASMAIAVIYGLAFATVLTLIVVPSMYVMLYKLLSRFGMGGLSKPEEDEPLPAAAPHTT